MTIFRYSIDRWPLIQPFRFAGFTITDLDCVHVRLKRGIIEYVLPR